MASTLDSPPAAAAAAAEKRYEALVTVRAKAIKGKGAWYWEHLEPLLLRSESSGEPTAVKLRCALCAAVFSASNPSRTASEHLKRRSCPNFSPVPLSSLPPPPSSSPSPPPPLYRKRLFPLADPSTSSAPPLAAAATTEKKTKSPRDSPVASLSKPQVEAAVSFLADWVFESGGAVSLSALSHPKLRSFLHYVGLPPVSPVELASGCLDSRFEAARADSDARLRDALFFQLAAQGCKSSSAIGLVANVPNGTPVFCNAVFTHGRRVPAEYAEDVLMNAVTALSDDGAAVQRCVGIVADRFKNTALRELENRNQWMVNLPCQLQAFRSLVKDFAGKLPLFNSVSHNCFKLVVFFNDNNHGRSLFHKHQLQELGHSCLLHSLRRQSDGTVNNFDDVFLMIKSIMTNARPLQLTVLDESFELVCSEDSNAGEMVEMVNNASFWTELEAVHSFVSMIKAMAREVEEERPLVGQCLPLWDELRAKVRSWCSKFAVDQATVDKVLDERFKRTYRPAWSAAFVLDPLYLTKDATGKYLPSFKRLSPAQEKDVDKLITRLVLPEEAHIALMELMKWRAEGLDPLYAQAVQVRQRDPLTGKMRIAIPQGRRLVWETCLSELKTLGKVAVRIIFLHATACGFKCSLPVARWVDTGEARWSKAAVDRAQKMIFVAANAKLERKEFWSEEEVNTELLAAGGGEDDLLYE